MAYKHVGTKYIKRPWDFENFLEFWCTLVCTPQTTSQHSLTGRLWPKCNLFRFSNFVFVKVYLGGSQFTLNVTKTADINQPKDTIYLFANIPFSVVTLAVNIWAIVIIRRKEKTGIHHLIVCDCVANIISFSHGVFRYNTLTNQHSTMKISTYWWVMPVSPLGR